MVDANQVAVDKMKQFLEALNRHDLTVGISVTDENHHFN